MRTPLAISLLCLSLLFSCKGTEAGGTQFPPVEAPSGVVVNTTSEGKAVVTWQDNSSGESGFSIWTKTSYYGLADKITEVGQDVTSCDITSFLKSGSSYYIGVAAEGTAGRTSSSEVKFSTLYSYTEVIPEPEPGPEPGPEPEPEPETPSVSIVGTPVCTNASIKVEYALKNLPKKSVTYGLTWNEAGGDSSSGYPCSMPGTG